MTNDEIILAILPKLRNDLQTLTMRQIAECCNMKAASLYNHFTSKEKLILYAFEQSYELYSEIYNNLLTYKEKPKDALFILIDKTLELYENDTNRFMFLLNNASTQLHYIQTTGNVIDALAKYHEHYKDNFKPLPNSFLTMSSFGILYGQIQASEFGRNPKDLRPYTQDIVNLCWSALKKD